MFLSMLSFLGLLPTSHTSKCKKLLTTTMERIKLLKSRREAQIRQLRMDMAQLLKHHNDQKAQVWLGHIWKEACLLLAYAKIANYCQSVQMNLKDIAEQRVGICPDNLEEPLAGLCFAALHCADLPELQELREIFAMKYGKGFVTSAQELHQDCHVNQEFLDYLCATDPSDQQKMALLEEIAAQVNAQDNKQQEIHESSSTEVSDVDADECNQSCDKDMCSADLANCKRTSEGRQLQRSKFKRALKRKLAWEIKDTEEAGNYGKVHPCVDEEGQGGEIGYGTRARLPDAHDDGYTDCGTSDGRQLWRSKFRRALRRKLAWENKGTEEEDNYAKVHPCVDEEGQGGENGNGTREGLADAHDDGYTECGSLQGEGTEPKAPNEDPLIILYVKEPLFSLPPRRPPPPPPPPKQVPPSLRVVSMPISHNSPANSNISLPLRCSTMVNNSFIESHVHPKLPKYEDFVANFTARKCEAFEHYTSSNHHICGGSALLRPDFKKAILCS